MRYADVIIDINDAKLDKSFQYLIPPELEEGCVLGAPVTFSFGSSGKERKGYIVGLSKEPKIAVEKIKPLLGVQQKGLAIEDSMVSLAYWMKEHYGGTMNEALRTVIPVKCTVAKATKKEITVSVSKDELYQALALAVKKGHTAKQRLLRELVEMPCIPYEIVTGKMGISAPTITALVKEGCIQVQEVAKEKRLGSGLTCTLNEEQQSAADTIIRTLGHHETYLLYGITGSGKTEVYLRVIEEVLRRGEQVIVLIPEISLTYQTVLRFYRCFGDRVAFLHSKLSKGERYQQSERAKKGEISIMIGPRSALFTPFPKLGLIVIDEEHESSYKSENAPKYHARETAVQRAKEAGCNVILGSATPSLESYTLASQGEYKLLTLTKRAKEARLAKAYIVDLRQELAEKNRSIFSRLLQEKIEDRLAKKEQIMLFLNRRGYAGFLSCRECGEVPACPHCDVSLTIHNNGTLQCHYCGYTTRRPSLCPSCGSKYLAGFGTGTQKIEELLKDRFPQARVLRMDADTTKEKDSYDKLLASFSEGEADILIGTQMIVKGHDFPKVTLMGVLAADLSLFASDYRAAERTFQLLAQAAGRAGRDKAEGEVVIQTYRPDHYAVIAAAEQDYGHFYEQEIAYRQMLRYPPVGNLLVVLAASQREANVVNTLTGLAEFIKRKLKQEQEPSITVIGPTTASLKKANDLYREVLYLKSADYDLLIRAKNEMEQQILTTKVASNCRVQFDFNPMNGY